MPRATHLYSIVDMTFTGQELWDIFEGIVSKVNKAGQVCPASSSFFLSPYLLERRTELDLVFGLCIASFCLFQTVTSFVQVSAEVQMTYNPSNRSSPPYPLSRLILAEFLLFLLSPSCSIHSHQLSSHLPQHRSNLHPNPRRPLQDLHRHHPRLHFDRRRLLLPFAPCRAPARVGVAERCLRGVGEGQDAFGCEGRGADQGDDGDGAEEAERLKLGTGSI